MIDIPFLLLVAGVGLVMGLLTTYVGLKSSIEFPLWLGIFLVLAMVGASVPITFAFLSFAIGGLLSGVISASIQVSQFERYRENNPWYGPQLEGDPAPHKRAMFVVGIGMGAFWGILYGGITVGFKILF